MFNELGMQSGGDSDSGLLEALLRRRRLEQGQQQPELAQPAAPIGQTAQRIPGPQAQGAPAPTQVAQRIQAPQQTEFPVQEIGPVEVGAPRRIGQPIDPPPYRAIDESDPGQARMVSQPPEGGAAQSMRDALAMGQGQSSIAPPMRIGQGQMGEQGPDQLSSQYRDLINADHPRPARPMVNQRINPQTGQPEPIHRGVLGQIGSRLKGMGQGALAGTAMAGPLGGVLGGITGGISPQAGSDMAYRQFTVPRWEHDTGVDQANAAHKLDRYKDVSGITGIDYATGKPTFQAESAALRRELQARSSELDAQRMLNQQQMNEARIRDLEAGRVDKTKRTAAIVQNANKGTLGVDSEGNQILTDRSKGTATTVTRPDGRPVGSMQGTQEAGRNRRFEEGRADKKQAAAGKAEASTLPERRFAEQQHQRHMSNAQALSDQFEKHKAEATRTEAEWRQMKTAYDTWVGDTRKVGSGEGGKTKGPAAFYNGKAIGPQDVEAAATKAEAAKASFEGTVKRAKGEPYLGLDDNDTAIRRVGPPEGPDAPKPPKPPRKVHGRPNGQGPLHPAPKPQPRRSPYYDR